MSRAVDSILHGLAGAMTFAQGHPADAKIHEVKPVDIKKIREMVSLSQTEFAQMFGIKLSTLRHWERGDRKPQGPALTLLQVIAHNPKLVMEAIR